MTNQSTESRTEFAAHIGIDWADQKHFWAMRTADGKMHRGELDNTPEAMEVWASELAQRFAGRLIAVALEQARGAVMAKLTKYAHLVLFPVHPNTLANYRQAFYPSGAKSDPSDAGLVLELLLRHPEKLRRWEPDTRETRQLQFLIEERRQLVHQHTAETQRLTTGSNRCFRKSCSGSRIWPAPWWERCCCAGRPCGPYRKRGPRPCASSSNNTIAEEFSSKTKFEHEKKSVDKSHVKVGDRAGVVGNKLPTGEWMANEVILGLPAPTSTKGQSKKEGEQKN